MLYLVGYGFKARNVRGLDMISYSPWIDLGNMHETEYSDNTWDAVLCGWTLPYSSESARAFSKANGNHTKAQKEQGQHWKNPFFHPLMIPGFYLG